ncbi:MAG: hypothetical protein ACI8RD_011869, partial [Bacillariaceae sp.]
VLARQSTEGEKSKHYSALYVILLSNISSGSFL